MRYLFAAAGIAIVVFCIVMILRGDPLYPKERYRGKHQR